MRLEPSVSVALLKAKVALRRLVSAVLELLPLSWLTAVRDARFAAPPGTLRRGLLTPLVFHLLRHRPLRPLKWFELPDNPDVRLVAAESRLVRRLYWMGEAGHEGQEAFWWRHYCKRADNVLELGANIGYYTVQGALAGPQAKFTAVEPHPVSASILRDNLQLNSLTNVRVVEAAAVGDVVAPRMQLHLPDVEVYTAPTGAYLSAGAANIEPRPAASSITVDVVGVRTLLQGVDLLKLDVEGCEYEILSSAEDVIREHRPVMFVEVLPQAPELRTLLLELQESAGYTVYAITATDHLVQLQHEDILTVDLMKEHQTRDVVLVPR